MELKIISQNNLGDVIKYPIEYCKFDARRMTWVSTPTSKKTILGRIIITIFN